MLLFLLAAAVPFSGTLPIIPDWTRMACLDYPHFSEAIDGFGNAKWTQTIETPSFPGLSKLIIVTVTDARVGVTKEIFGSRTIDGKDCVIVPALFVDHKPDAVPPLPILQFVREAPGDNPA